MKQIEVLEEFEEKLIECRDKNKKLCLWRCLQGKHADLTNSFDHNLTN